LLDLDEVFLLGNGLKNTVVIKRGDPLLLNCSVPTDGIEGSQEVTYEIIKDGYVISNNETYTINEISKRDDGDYKCIANVSHDNVFLSKASLLEVQVICMYFCFLIYSY